MANDIIYEAQPAYINYEDAHFFSIPLNIKETNIENLTKFLEDCNHTMWVFIGVNRVTLAPEIQLTGLYYEENK